MSRGNWPGMHPKLAGRKSRSLRVFLKGRGQWEWAFFPVKSVKTGISRGKIRRYGTKCNKKSTLSGGFFAVVILEFVSAAAVGCACPRPGKCYSRKERRAGLRVAPDDKRGEQGRCTAAMLPYALFAPAVTCCSKKSRCFLCRYFIAKAAEEGYNKSVFVFSISIIWGKT